MQDYVTSLSIDFSLIYAELALLAASFLILVTCFTRRGVAMAPIITGAGLLLSLMFAIEQWGDQAAGFAGMVSCDNFGVTFKIIFLVAAIMSSLIAHRYITSKGIFKPEYYALIMISTIGMMVMANTTDLLVMFLGLEIMSVPLYVLAAFHRRSLESNEAGIKYFIMGAFATSFLLMGIAFVFGAAETTDLRRIVGDFNYISGNSAVYLYTGVAFLLIGFGFKVGTVPFHSWIPDVYQGAPTPVTAFFSVAPKAAGFAAMLRIFLYGFEEMAVLSTAFSLLAILTMTLGNLLALRQDNIKRMLAYSSIAHAGYVLVAFATGGTEAVSAAIYYLVAYMIFNLGAFAVVTVIETRQGSTTDFSELVGFAKTHPYLAGALALFMFALSGFPPTVGFFGKFYLFSAAVQEGLVWLVVIGVLNSFVSVYYYLRVIKTSYFDETERPFASVTMTPAIGLATIIAAIGTLGLGLFPQQLLELTSRALFAFL